MTIARAAPFSAWFTRVARPDPGGISVARPPPPATTTTMTTQAPVPSGAAFAAQAAKKTAVSAPDLRAALPPLHDVAADVAWQFDALLGPEHAASGSDLAARAQALEDRAFEVLEVLTPRKVGEAEAAFDVWFDAVDLRHKGGAPLAAMEHLTVLHVLKSKLFDGQKELAQYLPRMEAMIVSSDKQLTGKERPLDQILARRLPRAALDGMSDDARKIHAAVFSSGGEGFTSAVSDLVKNYRPSASDPIVAVGLLAALFTGAGAAVVGGAVHGYLIATILEHTIHARVGHATPRTTEKLAGLLARFGPIGRAVQSRLEAIRFGHSVIHHGSYVGSYVDRFAPDDQRLGPQQVEEKRAKKKDFIDKQANSRSPDEAADIFKSDYGRKLADALGNALLTAPATALVTLFTGAVASGVGLTVGPLFVAASVLTSLMFIPASNNVHPYLHMTRDEAMAKARPLMRAFLQSRYISHIAQHHYLHHKDARVNHNLVPGADFALGYEPTKVEAIVALRRLKSFY